MEFDYAVKQESRQKLVNFVIRNYSSKERRSLEVACLPGVQALDIYRVMDKLGIPRKNVWGLERNREIYKILESQNLGINLFQGTDEEFFRETRDNFDVVSLDYFGQIKENEINSLRYLFGREVMKPIGVLHTNFYGSREHEKVKDIYQTGAYFRALTDSTKNIPVTNVDKLIEQGKTSKLMQRNYAIDLKDLREGLTRAIMNVAEKGKLSLEIDNLEEILYGPGKEAISMASSGMPYSMALYLTFKKSKPYFCDSLERYKYISNDGSPMLTDIFLFNQHREWFNEKKYPVVADSSDLEKLRVLVNNKPVVFSDKELTPHALASRKKGGSVLSLYSPLERKIINHAFDVYLYSGDLRQTDIIKERQFLGSSGRTEEAEKPEHKLHKEIAESTLSKERVIELLEEGKSPKWISENYSGNPNQYRAYKAWITMRKRSKP